MHTSNTILTIICYEHSRLSLHYDNHRVWVTSQHKREILCVLDLIIFQYTSGETDGGVIGGQGDWKSSK